jgi:hypothetical protein
LIDRDNKNPIYVPDVYYRGSGVQNFSIYFFIPHFSYDNLGLHLQSDHLNNINTELENLNSYRSFDTDFSSDIQINRPLDGEFENKGFF